VVYDDTLDDAGGMVHIRDLVAFMTERAAASAKANTRRKRPFPAGLDLKAVDLSMPLSATKIVREILYAPPSMPVLDLLAKMQTTRIHLALVVDEYGGADGVVSSPMARFWPMPVPTWKTSPRLSAANLMWPKSRRRWTRSLDTLRPGSGVCRCGVNSSPVPVRSKSKFSTPIPVG
jgi:hypothetical protein